MGLKTVRCCTAQVFYADIRLDGGECWIASCEYLKAHAASKLWTGHRHVLLTPLSSPNINTVIASLCWPFIRNLIQRPRPFQSFARLHPSQASLDLRSPIFNRFETPSCVLLHSFGSLLQH